MGEREPLATEHHGCVRAFNGYRPPSRLEKGWRNAVGTWCILALCFTRCVMYKSSDRIRTHLARFTKIAERVSQVFVWQVLISCRIPRFIVGWAPQACTAASFVTVLCTPALSNTHFCCVPDSCPTPQARLPRLAGPCEPVSPSVNNCTGGRITRLYHDLE